MSGAAVTFVLAVDLLLAAGPVPRAAHGGDRAPATPDLRRPEIPAFSGLYPPFAQLLRHPHRLHRGSEADQPGVHDGKVGVHLDHDVQTGSPWGCFAVERESDLGLTPHWWAELAIHGGRGFPMPCPVSQG